MRKYNLENKINEKQTGLQCRRQDGGELKRFCFLCLLFFSCIVRYVFFFFFQIVVLLSMKSLLFCFVGIYVLFFSNLVLLHMKSLLFWFVVILSFFQRVVRYKRCPSSRLSTFKNKCRDRAYAVRYDHQSVYPE